MALDLIMLSLTVLSFALMAAPGDAPRTGETDELQVLAGPDVAQLRVAPIVGFGLDVHNNPALSIGGRLEYSPGRAFGVELFGAYLRPSQPSDLALTELQARVLPATASKTQLRSVVGASLRWRPIYGALALGQTFVGRFRVDLGIGAGLASTRVECTNGLALDPNRGFPSVGGDTTCNGDGNQSSDGPNSVYYEPNTVRPVAILSSGVEVDILTNLALRLEVRDVLFVARVYRPDDGLDDAVVHRVFLQTGVSLIF